MSIENIAIDNEFTVSVAYGHVIVLQNNQVIAFSSFQGSKALISAAYEIQELRASTEALQSAFCYASPSAHLNEQLDDGTDTILSTTWGVSLLRHGQLWFNEDDLEHQDLWAAVGTELREQRARAAAL
jgi:hypothetical protein